MRFAISLALCLLATSAYADGRLDCEYPADCGADPSCSAAEFTAATGQVTTTLTTGVTNYIPSTAAWTEDFDYRNEFTVSPAQTRVQFSRSGETAGIVEACFSSTYKDDYAAGNGEIRWTIWHDDSSDGASPKKAVQFWTREMSDEAQRSSFRRCVSFKNVADADYFGLFAMNLVSGVVLTMQEPTISLTERASCPLD